MDLSTGMNDHGDGESYKAGVNARGRVGKVGLTLYTNYNKTRHYRETEPYSSKALNPKPACRSRQIPSMERPATRM